MFFSTVAKSIHGKINQEQGTFKTTTKRTLAVWTGFGPGLQFRRHCPQSPGDPEIKGGSGHGNKNFRLLTQVCTTDHNDSLGKGTLFQVNDTAPISFRKYLG
jgi:hypothetical protein